MTKNFHEQFSSDVRPPSDRSTGLVFAAVALILAVVVRHDWRVAGAAAMAAAVLVAISLLAPRLLHPLNVAWFGLALLLNRIVSPIVMLTLFAVTIVPFGLVMQMRYDPLRKRRQAAAESYWIERKRSATPSSMVNQF